MKVDRIALEEFKRFRAPLVLDDLSDGLNLFVGENEAGKSTVAMAVRAAFLERARTKTVTDFAPWGTTGARPSVALDFRIGENRYLLRKHFLTKSRCELIIKSACSEDGNEDGNTAGTDVHSQRLEGEAAEDALAALLGFDFSAKGQSQAKQAGIPGLLWIRQGEGQDIADPATHAELHLRDALTRLTGEMASSDGDRLFTRVSAERAVLLDVRGSRPKGIYREAEEALSAAQALVMTLQSEKAQLDADVDRLAQRQNEHAAAERAQPWKEFETQALAASARLADIITARAARDALQREHDAAAAMLEALQGQVGRDIEDDDALALQQREVQALQDRVAASDAEQRQLADILARSESAWKHANELANQLQAEGEARSQLQDIDEQLARWATDVRQLTETLAEAGVVQQTLEALTQRLSTTLFDLADLQSLRKHERVLSECRIRQEAAATRLSYWLLPEVTIPVADHSSLSGNGERLVSEAVILEMVGVGRLCIEPGGQDLPALAATLSETLKAQADSLLRMGVASLAEAEAIWVQREVDQRNVDAAQKEWRIRAPQGMDVLRATLQTGALRQQALTQRRQRLVASFSSSSSSSSFASPIASSSPSPSAPEASRSTQVGAEPMSLAEALARLNTAAAAFRHAEKAHEIAQTDCNMQVARLRLLSEQIAQRMAVMALPERQRERQQRAARLIEQRSLADDLRRRIAEAERQLALQQPDLAEQDCQRFERSAAAARASHQTRHHEILTLMGRLEQAGARGVGEDLLRAHADVERLARRRDEIALRANGLNLLAGLLQQKREAATRRLQTPLARRLNHYLHLLFPGATLRLGDDLLPVDLHRHADQQDALLSLSFGTREQLGLLVRLAYADLLREAGRPTLLILDDALVHADSARRALMKRALFDAASRHQILMFTCHGEAWQDLGVIQRPLASASAKQ